ncbi:MAG: YbaB/EbfC family nucleoid-associated protein [Candidatus Omnitrophica bacterium]|nr:YbaB/EbfC family nucleoid-associated protein [Candidatus Omnitrophota bacterium]MCM8809785.1 YbaB/EbfC family nucleoid-associated protein [Candidatus Omnitrophota bacterium]MCM8810036.1 YbaB/EbfC family nucleoid-associated protein [Candidatus Omnitrophota bacterium]MCM8832796.1 YbaB/EbfC family nucleoid-associated protein [Candidatus Omnitrophota bacterium]
MGIFDNLKQMAQLKQQASQFQKLLESKIVEVSSPNSEIKLKINGKMDILNIEISELLLKPENKTYLEKLIKKTFNEAKNKAEKIIASEIKSQMGFPF